MRAVRIRNMAAAQPRSGLSVRQDAHFFNTFVCRKAASGRFSVSHIYPTIVA